MRLLILMSQWSRLSLLSARRRRCSKDHFPEAVIQAVPLPPYEPLHCIRVLPRIHHVHPLHLHNHSTSLSWSPSCSWVNITTPHEESAVAHAQLQNPNIDRYSISRRQTSPGTSIAALQAHQAMLLCAKISLDSSGALPMRQVAIPDTLCHVSPAHAILHMAPGGSAVGVSSCR